LWAVHEPPLPVALPPRPYVMMTDRVGAYRDTPVLGHNAYPCGWFTNRPYRTASTH